MCFTEGMTNDNLINQNYKKLCFDKIKIVPIMILFLVLKIANSLCLQLFYWSLKPMKDLVNKFGMYK
jgi:hypothetical protein